MYSLIVKVDGGAIVDIEWDNMCLGCPESECFQYIFPDDNFSPARPPAEEVPVVVCEDTSNDALDAEGQPCAAYTNFLNIRCGT